MKKTTVAKVGENTVNLKGYDIKNQERVSSLTCYVFRQILHSIFYCLCSLKVMTPEDSQQIFKVKDNEEAKKMFLKL